MTAAFTPPLSAAWLKVFTAEWLVAVTIASEVPPRATRNKHSQQEFTDAMIDVALRAVTEVIVNRTKADGFPNDALSVVLAPKQFSGVLRGVSLRATGHRDFWLDAVCGRWYPEHVERALAAWRQREERERIAPGALHYYSPVGMVPPHRVPGWAARLTPVPVAGLASDFFRFFG